MAAAKLVAAELGDLRRKGWPGIHFRIADELESAAVDLRWNRISWWY